ncbi:MAG: erythromycin esterase family protein [Planctomycetota bacterium]
MQSIFILPVLMMTASHSNEEVPAAAKAWIERHAIPLTSVEAENGFDDLRALATAIGKARIVALGEPTHGTREAFQLKHRLVEFLASEMGFTHFSIEASSPESFAIDPYVQNDPGETRSPEELIGGMYFWTWNTEEVRDMVTWMRRFNAGNAERKDARRIHFTGFDMQTPNVAATIVRSYLEAHDTALLERSEKTLDDAVALRLTGPRSTFGVATGSFPCDSARGKKIVFRGWIRTQDLTDGRAGLWWRADGPDGATLAFDNMQDRGPSGTSEWAEYSLALDVPSEVVNINFGALMAGDGKAWFDDLTVELDGVAFDAPSSFDFSFETSSIRGLYCPQSADYRTGLSTEQPHGGEQCLEIARTKQSVDETAPSASDVRADVDALHAEMLEKRDAYAVAAGTRASEWAIHNARILVQYAEMMARTENPTSVNIRDRSMAENVAWLLEQNPNAKVVLWAHNAHVGRQRESMGEYLEKRFQGEMVVIGFATSSGDYTAVGGAGLTSHELQAPPSRSIESYLASADKPVFLLDLRAAKRDDAASAWLTEAMPMRSIGARAMEQQFFPTVARESYDVLAYIRDTTAARQLASKTARAR